jgi:hypothetical protein
MLIKFPPQERRKRKLQHKSCRTIGLLKSLGVPEELLYARGPRRNASFWNRSINHLHVLEQARRLYRTQIFEVHPDRVGGSPEPTMKLNHTWATIRRTFRTHGHELG